MESFADLPYNSFGNNSSWKPFPDNDEVNQNRIIPVL